MTGNNTLYNAGGKIVTSCSCRDCVCLAICKQKYIRRLFNDCAIASRYVRPYGTDEVDGFAVMNMGRELGRNFKAIYNTPSDKVRTIIRDQDKYRE
jgi:hypothetical protein